MKYKIDYSVYLVTDRDLMSTETLESAVEQALEGGATLIQLREKNLPYKEFLENALKIKKITDRFNVPLIINDSVQVAIDSGAAGLHIGQSDIPASEVRKVLGAGRILGVSVSNLEQALKAERDGADYLGAGAMHFTNTKTEAEVITVEELKKITAAVKIPVVTIGGMNKDTIPLLAGTGIAGAAVVSGIISQPDVRKAASEIKKIFAKIK